MWVAKTRHARVHGDITLPSLCTLSFCNRVYRVRGFQTLHSIPSIIFYEWQVLRLYNCCIPTTLSTTASLHCRQPYVLVKETKWNWCASSTPARPPRWCGARMAGPSMSPDKWWSTTRATDTPSRLTMLLRMTLESMSVRRTMN